MAIEDYLTSIATFILTLIVIISIKHMFKEKGLITKDKIIQQIILFTTLLTGLLITIFLLPVPADVKQTILSFLGIVAGAAVAFSSTTFIANSMSGIMLRFIKPFKVGDYIRVEDTFGRVSAIQILHTQVQSIDRDLITVPNLKLVSSPLKTIRSTGTIINTTVSLGYDISRKKIEDSLIAAAKKTGLESPFVHVVELGDFSITYKVGGLLKDIDVLVTTNSDFKKNVIDALHENNVEIVSPNFMNQRILKDDAIFIPPKEIKKKEEISLPPEKKAEEVIFDKAIIAESMGKIKELLSQMEIKRKETDEKMFGILILPESKRTSKGYAIEKIKNEIENISQQQEMVKNTLEALTKKLEAEEELPSPEIIVKALKSMEDYINKMNEKHKEIEQDIQKVSESILNADEKKKKADEK